MQINTPAARFVDLAQAGGALDGQPHESQFNADVIAIDFAGFSELTNRFIAERGDGAAEELCDMLNRGFGAVTELLSTEGFRVVSELGDGLLAFRSGDLHFSRLADLTNAIEVAFAGAVPPYRARAAWGKGRFAIYRVGGWRGDWRIMATGPAVEMAHASLGRRRAVTGAELSGPPDVRRAPASRPRIPPTGEQAVEIARATAEVRWLTMLFAQFLADPDQTLSLPTLQNLVLMGQRMAEAFDGHLENVTHDDKGVLLNFSFADAHTVGGTSFDSAASCVRDLETECEGLGFLPRFGMAEGFVYRGPIELQGSTITTIHGPAVNIAAKLTCVVGGRFNVRPSQTTDAQERLARHGFRGQWRVTEFGNVLCLRLTGTAIESDGTDRKAVVVGREQELHHLMEALAASERSSVVLALIGPAGIGKSTLLSAFHRAVDGAVKSILTRCDPRHVDDPYFLWRDVLTRIVESVDENLEVRARWIDEAFATEDIGNEFTGVLSDVVPGLVPPSELAASLQGAARRDAIERAILALLKHATRAERVHLGVDDAQWLDAASLRILRELAKVTTRLLVVLAYRDEFGVHDSHLALFGDRATVRHLELGPLTQKDLEFIFAPTELRLSEQSLARLLDLSGGNPLYAEQIIHWMRSGGDAAILNEEAVRPVAPAAARASGIIGRVLDARLDRFTQDETRVARFLAVLDQPAMARDIEIGVGARVDASILEGLTGKAILAVREDNRGVAEREFQLKHRLIADAVLMRIPPSQLRYFHRKSARMLGRKRRYGDVTIGPALLAHHWREAGDRSRAAVCFGEAADSALDAAADRQALGFYDSAIAMVSEHDKVPPLPRITNWYAGRASAFWSLGRLRPAAESVRRGLELLDDRLSRGIFLPRLWRPIVARLRRSILPLLGLASVALPQSCRASLMRLNIVRCETAIHFGDALEFAGASAALLTLSRDRHLRSAARAYTLLGYATGMTGWGGRLSRLAFEAAKRAAGDSTKDGRPFARLSGAQAMLLSTRGDWGTAAAKLQEAVAYASHPRDPQALEFAEVIFAVNAYFQGRWEESVARFHAVVETARARDCELHQGWGLYGQAQALLIPGKWAEAVALLDQADPIIADQAERQSAVICAGIRAQAYYAMGEQARALACAMSAFEIANVLPCINYTSLEGYAAAAEIALRSTLDSGTPGAMRAVAEKLARRAIRPLVRYTRTFAIGSPRLLLCRGLAARLAGSEQLAERAWRSGIESARRLSMAHEQRKLEELLARP